MKHMKVCSTLLLLLCAPVWAGPNKANIHFSDEAVGAAIDKAIAYIWSQQKADGSWPEIETYSMGPTALAAYALLEAGVNPQDPRMVKTLDWLKDNTDNKTYSIGLRCNVWAIANKKADNKYKEQLEKDVKTLVDSTSNGTYGYNSLGDGKSAGDNSNSQYGLLGVWAGARSNVEIDSQYWFKVIKHWISAQCADGAWSYNGSGEAGSATMAAAGVASLFVCFDNLYAEAFEKCELSEKLELKPIARGLAWFDKNFEKTMGPNAVLGLGDITYYLYGVERVGLASGYKYFGSSDWYKLGANRLLSGQGGNGAWNGMKGPNVATPLALLFLIRGRNSVLFNKLEYTGDWNNRPRALASLTAWISKTMENTVNWQIVTLKSPVSEWHDAPIMFIAGAKAPEFSDDDIAKLRTYVYQGGMIFSSTECTGEGFRKGIRDAYAKMFPGLTLTPVDKDHDINTISFRLKNKPKLEMISNGIRPLVIHSDDDLPLRWQTNSYMTNAWAYEGAANIALYVTDRGSLRARGTALWPADAPAPGGDSIKIARLKHSGAYDPEPMAYTRFARMMALDDVNVEVVGPIEMKALEGSGARIASLTGVGKVVFSQDEQDAIEKFVATGGTLIIDAAGGSKEFAQSAEAMVNKIYGAGNLQRLTADAAIFKVPGVDPNAVRFRRITKVRVGSDKSCRLMAVTLNKRPAVYFSREDITAGLVGYPSLTADGYAPLTAYALLKGIVCSAAPASQPAPLPPEPAAEPAEKK